MNTLSLRTEICARVAQLIAMDVRDITQIAQATGLPESHVLQIMQAEETVQQVQALRTKQLDDARTLNNGWDAVEEEAVGTVLEALRHGADQEYALRAAAVANKAQRRGANGLRNTITPVAGATAVIDLKAVYIERLQQMTVAQARVRDALAPEGAATTSETQSVAPTQRKRVNVLPLTQIDRVLGLAPQGADNARNDATAVTGDFTAIFQQLRPAFQAALA